MLWLACAALFVSTFALGAVLVSRARRDAQNRERSQLDPMLPTLEECLQLAQDYRVWSRLMLDAGGAPASQANLRTPQLRAELLARAQMESQLSVVCSRGGTQMVPHVMRALRAQYGELALRDAIERLSDAMRADTEEQRQIGAMPFEPEPESVDVFDAEVA